MDLDTAMARFRGVARRQELLQALPRARIDSAMRSGRLARVLPGVLMDGWLVDDDASWLLAIEKYAGGRGWLSHATALAHWGLIDRPVVDHVTVERGLRLTGNDRLVVHEASSPADAATMVRAGLRVANLETAWATSWALLAEETRRAAAIEAVRDRRTTPHRLEEQLRHLPRVKGRADMLELCALLKAGAHSEFEIWGLQHFFTPDLLRRSVAQYTVNLGSRTVYLDRGFPEEMVGIELDGTRWHDRPDRRELDRRRDAALARAGWLVIRISYRRATSETQQARRDVIEVLATRREQLGLPPAASKRRVMRPSAARHAAVRLLSDA